MMFHFKRIFISALISILSLFWLGIAPVHAQDSASANQVETQTFKDWVVRCVEREILPPCDAVQAISSNETGNRVMLTSVAYLGDDAQVGIQIWVQTGVLVSAGVLVEVDESEAVLQDLQFTRCESDGCFIEAIVAEETLTPLKKGAEAAVAVLASSGQPRIIGLSLSGFTQAYNTVKEANAAWFNAQ